MVFEKEYFEDEVRDGFYVPAQMKHAWAAQLEVLNDIDKACTENEIQYFAEWGTLLGAVRHHGFIPWDDDMDIKQLCKYFNRKEITIRKAINKMCDSGLSEYKSYTDEKAVISCKGVEWICKNVFKQKYLELLEKKKMELTEKYIEAGYIYDHFFHRN